MEIICISLATHKHLIGGGVTVSNHAIDASTSAFDFLIESNSLKSDSIVLVNGEEKNAEQLKTLHFQAGDQVNIIPVQGTDDNFTNALIFASVAWFTAGTGNAFLTSISTAATGLAASSLITEVFGPNARQGFDSNQGATPVSYSISGGSNSVRRYGPLPVIMGTHRVFPDYSSPYVLDYVYDPSNIWFQCGTSKYYESRVVPHFDFTPVPSNKPISSFTEEERNPTGWTQTQQVQWYGQVVYYKDSIPVTVECASGISGAASSSPNSFLIRVRNYEPTLPWPNTSIVEISSWDNNLGVDDESRWVPYTHGMSASVLVGYGTYQTEVTQRIKNVFCYGLGDLTYSDHRIGTSVAAEYKDLQVHQAVNNGANSSLTDSEGEYPTNCESVAGGALNEQIGWVVRSSSRDSATKIGIDFNGRLFKTGNNGPEVISRTYDCEYKLSSSSTWIKAPSFPVSFSNGDYTPYRVTKEWAVPAGKYDVRVKRVDADDTDSRVSSEITFERAKFYVSDPSTTYPAINRLGVQLRASGQLNGALDRWNSLVKSKCWVYDTSKVYDGSLPGGANWSWTYTSNPAYWLLYFAVGGYLNSTETKGWKWGVNASNSIRLFGAGMSLDEIDFYSIVRFAKYCESKSLSFNYVVNTQMPSEDVLMMIASAGRGSITRSSGKLAVVIAQQSDIPVAMFGMGNIVAGSFSISYSNIDKTDEYVGTFYDETEDYAPKQVRALVPGVTQPVSESTVQLAGITNENQAQREIRLRAANSKYHIRAIQFDTSLEGMVPQRGDVIIVAHDLTAWAYSGRLVDINGSDVKLPYEIDAISWIQIKLPDGSFHKSKVNAVSSKTDTFTLVDAVPVFSDTFPEDYIFQCGAVETTGKRCRVVSVEPSSVSTVKITCTDDESEYYLSEFSTQDGDFDSGEKLIAKVFNAHAEKRDDGYWLVWELENATGANVSVFVNGVDSGTITGSLTVPGLELKLPNHPVGTVFTANLVPHDVVSSVAIESTSTTFTYE